MDAQRFRFVWLLLLALIGSMGASYRTENFVVTASSPRLAEEIGLAAEDYRRQLAEAWLGRQLPPWQRPCPIVADVDPRKGAGGATSFMFRSTSRQYSRPVGDGLFQAAPVGRPYGWEMTLQGSRERILDSVLPHEVTHAIFATHFGRPLPRWADEGACTTVEHDSERRKQDRLLQRFLRTGKGIAFNKMFAMDEYPPEMLPLYSQGYSLTKFLIARGGRRKFVRYVGDGLKTNDWNAATRKHYGFQDLSDLQLTWLDWVRAGSPDSVAARSSSLAESTSAREASHGTDTVASVTNGEGGWYARQKRAARRGLDRSAGAGRSASSLSSSFAANKVADQGQGLPANSAGRLVPVPPTAAPRTSFRSTDLGQ